MPPDVMLAFPHPGTVKTEFMLSVFDACSSGRVAELRDFRTGPAMAQARNQISKIFLESGLPWLWTVDADMVFSARTLPALLEAADPDDVPVVAPLCFVQCGPDIGEQIPNMYRAIRHPDDGKFVFKSLEQFPLGQLVQVGATGAGAMLIHRDVFARIEKKFPDHAGLWWAETIADGTLFGEDFSFCMRAGAAGVPVHVHTGVEVGHTKSNIIGRVTP